MTVFWIFVSCSLVEINWRFKGVDCLHHQGFGKFLRLNGASTRRTVVFTFYLHKSPPLEPAFSQLILIHTFTPHFGIIHLNILLPYNPKFHRRSLPPRQYLASGPQIANYFRAHGVAVPGAPPFQWPNTTARPDETVCSTVKRWSLAQWNQ
jgi:hypothetical protein